MQKTRFTPRQLRRIDQIKASIIYYLQANKVAYYSHLSYNPRPLKNAALDELAEDGVITIKDIGRGNLIILNQR